MEAINPTEVKQMGSNEEAMVITTLAVVLALAANQFVVAAMGTTSPVLANGVYTAIVAVASVAAILWYRKGGSK